MNSQGFKNNKVFVGLSGGVDSAVSVALLKMTGYDVTGVFIKVWQPEWIICNWKEERRDAMRVAARLNIPFITLDLEKEYKESVIDNMIAEYQNGQTPNPDIMCNREVKFGAFWRFARSRGANYIATGHYARIFVKLGVGSDPKKHAPNIYELHIGKDINKDQSYFLWTLNQEDLVHVIFPVGQLTKTEVRKLARKLKLPNADKKDSQGLCFMGKVDVNDFLSHYVKTEPGNVLNEHGEIIGRHPGALFFTIGERHGFTIVNKTSDERRYYVVDKDMEQNSITVSNRVANIGLGNASRKVRIMNVNWIRGSAWDLTVCGQYEYPFQARIRYRQPLRKIKILSINIGETTVEFEGPIDSPTPGQSLVIYDGNECIGGGIIV